MWLTTLAVAAIALVQVNAYPAFQPPSLAEGLPIECPFHREPLDWNHPKNTVVGTLTQSGNYKFSNIPGNLINSVQDYADKITNNPYISQAFQSFPRPDFQWGYQQPEQSYPEYEATNQYPYQEAGDFAQIPPFYEIDNNIGYNQDFEQAPENDGYYSILPYEEQSNQEFEQAPENDGYFSILPYKEQSNQGNEEVNSDAYYGNDEVEQSEQQNDYYELYQISEASKSDLLQINTGAHEEIIEAEGLAANKIAEARARVAGLSSDSTSLISTAKEGFTRGLFSLFKPQQMMSIPLKAAQKSVDQLVFSPLQTISKGFTQSLTAKTPKAVPEQPQVLAQNDKPEVKNIEIDNSQPNQVCLSAVENNLQLEINENIDESQQCISVAEARFLESAEKTRHLVNQDLVGYQEANEHEIEQLQMCANSQFQRCNEEISVLQQTVSNYASAVNAYLAELTNGEDILTYELAACESNARTRMEGLKEEADSSRSEC